MDDFKKINDTYGHYIGYVVLEYTGETLRNVFRGEDIIGRWDGDEFLVVAGNLCSDEVLAEKCRYIGELLMKKCMKKSNIQVTCSIGALIVNNQKADFASIFREADNAMYKAKAEGKGKYMLTHYSNQIS